MISNKQNFKIEAIKVGFVLVKIKMIEKFKLKINLLGQKLNNQFYTRPTGSFQLLNAKFAYWRSKFDLLSL